jgi:hypothetical protein
MIHVLKKGGITLSNWILDSRMNWMKHRVLDYSEPMDVITIVKGYDVDNWAVYFRGPNIKYVEYLYNQVYGDLLYIPDDNVERAKKQIDNLLVKADKLIIFS